MPRRRLRFVLLQVRNPGDPVREEERQCFLQRLEVDHHQLHTLDVLAEPLTAELHEAFDAVLVGGSGEYSVLDDDARIKGLIDFLGETAEEGVPTFASCFGFQALTVALGGEVVNDPAAAEVGTFELERHPDALADPLFGHLPERFYAQQGHKDRALRLPEGAIPLARSTRAPWQAFRWREHPVWATQFHPEMTHHDNRLRIERYKDRYQKEAEAALATSAPSPEASSLLSRFVDLLAERKASEEVPGALGDDDGEEPAR